MQGIKLLFSFIYLASTSPYINLKHGMEKQFPDSKPRVNVNNDNG